MEKRHLEAIASAIRDANAEYAEVNGGNTPEVRKVATYIADECAKFNPRFDRKRFMSACGFRFAA